MENSGCANPELSRLITHYCFRDPMSEEDRHRLEAHLLECDACLEEVLKLDQALRILQTDPAIRKMLTTMLIEYCKELRRNPERN